MSRRIVLIGAGSVSFTRGLVADLIQASDLGPWELRLVDIDPQALETAVGLVQRMVAARDRTISVRASTQRSELLPGADIVVATVGVGGRRAWEADVFIPRKYGVYQPVGDTTMPGGISRAMRMVPAMVEIAKDIKSLCPEALFFNYSNPMTANCLGIYKATDLAVTGLCHGTFHVESQLADFIGAPVQEISSMYAGLNHLTFIYDLRWRGRDVWPLVRARIAAERGELTALETLREEFPDMGETSTSFTVASNPFSWSLFERYGAYPAVNDRHVVEFFPERFPQGEYYGKILGQDAFSFEGTIAGGDDGYASMREQAMGQAPLDEQFFERAAGEHEKLVEILRAMVDDKRQVFAVNLPNKQSIANLPVGAVLELPAISTATGLRPLVIDDFPAALAAIITRKAMTVELTVEAALRGDRQLFVEAVLSDGSIYDVQVASAMVDELLEVHKAYLPY